MQHLDDGFLQSWLDRDRSGITEAEAAEVEAHAAGCEACAARLTELEETSERSRSLLAAAAPSEEPAPDFEDVLRRSRRRAGGHGRGRAWKAATWAASLVAAVGLGWLSHGVLGPGADPDPAPRAVDAEGMVTAADPGAVEAERREAAGAGGEASAGTSAAADRGADVPVANPGRAATGDAGAPTQLARTEPPPQDSAGRDADIVLAPTTFQDASSLDTAERARETAVAAAPPAEAADAPVEMNPRDPVLETNPRPAVAGLRVEPRALFVQGRVSDGDGAPLASAVVSLPGTAFGAMTGADGTFWLSIPADAVAAEFDRSLSLRAGMLGYESATRAVEPRGTDTLSVDFRLESRALSLQEIVVTGTVSEHAAAPAAMRARAAQLEAPGEAWTPAARPRAEAEAEFAILTVPGLPVIEVELGELGEAVAVRVRQELESGATLTLVLRRVDTPAVEPTLPEGQAVATVEREGLRITGAAPVSVDSLRALLGKLR